jgi:hypothetical protein
VAKCGEGGRWSRSVQAGVPTALDDVSGEKGQIVISLLKVACQGYEEQPYEIRRLDRLISGHEVGEHRGPGSLAGSGSIAGYLTEEGFSVTEVILHGGVVSLSGRLADVAERNGGNTPFGKQLLRRLQDQVAGGVAPRVRSVASCRAGGMDLCVVWVGVERTAHLRRLAG